MDPVETLRSRLHDRAAWAVFADWLTTHGDPTGELCALELQKPADRSRILELKRQRVEGRGGWHPLDVKVAQSDLINATWFAGHLEAVELQNPWEGSAADELRAALEAPCGRFLRALILSQHYPDDVSMGAHGQHGEWEWAADALLSLGAPSLTELTLGSRDSEQLEFAEGSNSMVTTTRPRTPGGRIIRPSRWIGDVQPLFAKFPSLRRLELRGEGVRLSELPARLERLVVRGRFVRASTLQSIGATPLPDLSHLVLWPGHWPDSAPHFEPPEPELFYGRATSEADLAALLTGQHVPKLKNLAVSNSSWTAAFLAALAESPLAAQLEWLDVHNGLLDERDVDQLVRLAPRLRHLQWFDLSRHRIVDPEAQARLKAAFGEGLVLGEQFVPEPDPLVAFFS